MKAKLIDKYYASDPITFDQMREIVKYLIGKSDYRFCLFIACGCFMGLRVSDLLKLKFSDIEKDSFFINEKKTNKLREIAINPELRSIISQCVPENIYDKEKAIFSHTNGKLLTVQGINARLKVIKKTLNLQVNNFSCHSLRKCMAVQMYNDMGRTEHALLYLQKVLNHTSSATTIVYLGLQRDVIKSLYMNLGQGIVVQI